MGTEISARQATRKVILEAAAKEFAARGLAGARIEQIAARAGRNKALVYRYFGNKPALFRAVLKDQFRRREEILASVPEGLGDALVHWFEQTSQAPEFSRLIQREALSDTESEVVQQAERQAYYRKQIELLRVLQREEGVVPGLDPTHLFLALLSLIAYPSAFPQITRLVTGHNPDSPAFHQSWTRLLRGLARHLESSATPGGE